MKVRSTLLTSNVKYVGFIAAVLAALPAVLGLDLGTSVDFISALELAKDGSIFGPAGAGFP